MLEINVFVIVLLYESKIFHSYRGVFLIVRYIGNNYIKQNTSNKYF